VEEVRRRLVSWIKDRVTEVGAEGTVFGLSGGIDSAVVGALCREAVGGKALGLLMPINSLRQDMDDARLVAEHFGIASQLVSLEPAFGALLASLPEDASAQQRRNLALANLKPRLRMVTLYYYANALNYLVVGTGNRSELAVGYFTKFGDGASDILPIGNLVKRQVRELARLLGVPQPVIDKPPSAGLWAGQTDEGEMGITYQQLDDFLLTGRADRAAASLIATRARLSEHKRRLAPIPSLEYLFPEGWR
jgi:NAD+ synthase